MCMKKKQTIFDLAMLRLLDLWRCPTTARERVQWGASYVTGSGWPQWIQKDNYIRFRLSYSKFQMDSLCHCRQGSTQVVDFTSLLIERCLHMLYIEKKNIFLMSALMRYEINDIKNKITGAHVTERFVQCKMRGALIFLVHATDTSSISSASHQC